MCECHRYRTEYGERIDLCEVCTDAWDEKDKEFQSEHREIARLRAENDMLRKGRDSAERLADLHLQSLAETGRDMLQLEAARDELLDALERARHSLPITTWGDSLTQTEASALLEKHRRAP